MLHTQAVLALSLAVHLVCAAPTPTPSGTTIPPAIEAYFVDVENEAGKIESTILASTVMPHGIAEQINANIEGAILRDESIAEKTGEVGTSNLEDTANRISELLDGAQQVAGDMVTALAAEAAPTSSGAPAAAPTSSAAPAAAPTPPAVPAAAPTFSAAPIPPVARRSNDIQKRGFADFFKNIGSKLSGVASTLVGVATKYGPSVVSGVVAGVGSYFENSQAGASNTPAGAPSSAGAPLPAGAPSPAGAPAGAPSFSFF